MNKEATLRINGERLWDRLMALAEIGATPAGGNCRLALTALDGKGRDLVTGWAREMGCTIRVDAIGNIFMRRAGLHDMAAVMTGSHIDTQPTGGKFDGNFGVLSGIEVMNTLHDAGIVTERPIEVVVWTNEEGSRFVPVMMGSGVYCEAFSLESALALKDLDGITVAEALTAIGYAGHDTVAPPAAYFEAHIEQGPVLEANGKTIGVVSGALGQRWYNVTVTGMEAHAGPTPMPMRRDALLCAAKLIEEVNEIALAYAPNGRGTVGWIESYPNSRNVIPGQVRFSVDLRAPDETTLSAMDARLRAACEAACAGVWVGDVNEALPRFRIEVEQVVYFPAQAFDADLIDCIAQASAALDFSAMPTVSGAGHDAVYLARMAPAAMIFVPCKDGISHNEIESAEPVDLEAGCNVLLHAILATSRVR